MRITCPACGYRRDIPGKTVPNNAAVATCPKCRHRFSFRAGAGLPDGDNFLLEQDPGQNSGAGSPGDSPSNAPDNSPDNAPDSSQNSSQSSSQGNAPGDTPGDTPGSAPGETREKDIWDHLDERGISSESAEGGGDSQDRPPEGGEQAGEETFAPGFEPPHEGWDAPWERLDLHGFFQGFWLTIKGVMFAAPTFFQGLRVGNGFARPLVFYILVMEFEALCQYFWHTMGMGFMADMEGLPESETGMVAGIGMGMLLLLTPLLAVVTIFITSALFHLTLTIVRAETRGFEGTFRAVAYGSAPMVLAVIPVVGAFAGFIWVLVVRIIALKHIHRATYIQIILATVLLISLIALLISLTFKVMVG